MKKIIPLIILLLLVGCAAEQAPLTETSNLSEEVTLYVSADLHWQAPDSSHRLPYIDEVLDTLLYETINGAPSALILCGDLANSGWEEEHLAVAELLREVEADGVEVFVTMGNHDMYGTTDPDLIEEIYAEFGFDEATSKDTNSMSYLAKLTDEMWLLSIDTNQYGDRTSDMAGHVSKESLEWIESCLIEAAEQGATVVPFSHHNLVVNSMDNIGQHYNIDTGDEIKKLMLEYNIPVYLSGHRHGSSVLQFEGDGKTAYELVVDMPANYPYRYMTLDFKTNGSIDYNIPPLDIEGWAKEMGRTEPELLNFEDFSEDEAYNRTLNNATNIVTAMTDDKEEQEELIRYFVDFNLTNRTKTMWKEFDRLKNDPALELWMKYSETNVYGRWMPWVFQYPKNDNPRQTLIPIM